jgi:hypothetical protein
MLQASALKHLYVRGIILRPERLKQVHLYLSVNSKTVDVMFYITFCYIICSAEISRANFRLSCIRANQAICSAFFRWSILK